MILIPEFIIFESLKNLLKLIRTDYNATLFTGTTATGTAVITDGGISNINITNGGTLYPFAPIVNIVGDGTGASAIAFITAGVVTSIEVIGGTGYTTATISFSPDTTKSLLYRLLFGSSVQRYKLFEQAKTIFITTEDDPRHLDVNMFFNAKRAAIPTIHITLPSEAQKNNAMNNSEGFRATVFDDQLQKSIAVYNKRFGSTYNIIITSDNTNEVILLYHFIRSVLISMNAHFTLAGLENPKLSGGDLNINSELVPLGIFMRAIGLEFEYDVEAQDLFSKDVLPMNLIEVSSLPTVVS